MMSIEEWRKEYNKKLKVYDEKNKNRVFERIHVAYEEENKLLEKIEKLHERFGLKIKFNNCTVTLNNKVVELQNEFENAGISLFSHRDEEYGTIGPSVVGTAILTDMLDYTYDRAKKLEKHGTIMENIILKKSENSLEKISVLGRIFSQLRSLVFPKLKKGFSKEEIDEVNQNATECIEGEEQLWRYNIKDNILDSVTKYIQSKKYPVKDTLELVYLYVIPDLERLGLSELVPEIKVRIAEYENGNKLDWPYKIDCNIGINKIESRKNQDVQHKEFPQVSQEDTDEKSM